MRAHRPHLSSAHLIALVALFISLGGTSYAVSKIAENSVGSEQVRDQSLKAVDLAPGVALSGPRGARGPEGPAGPAGPQGPAGPSTLYVTTPKGAALAREPRVVTTVAAIRDVPAGDYLIVFTGQAALRVAGAGMYLVCDVVVNGDPLVSTAGIVGDQFGGEEALAVQSPLSAKSAFNLTVQCYTDQTTNGLPGPAVVTTPRLSALQTQRIIER